jgi:hypothetical protein
MGTAKTVQLIARSASAANLAFEVGGIILESQAQLGQQVQAFDFTSFYKTLGVATEPAKPPVRPPISVGSNPPFTPYLYDSADLDKQLGQTGIIRLRAEPIKALLDKSCAARANLYFNRYGHADYIGYMARQFYSGNASKGNALADLFSLSASKAEALSTAYQQDGLADPGVAGVVRQINSATKGFTVVTNQAGSGDDSTTENTTYTGNPYKHPFTDAVARGYRAQVNLNDERFADFLATLSLSNLEEVLSNELLTADMDVKRFQVAYLNTILLPAISGTITAIYKNVGEAVAAGEPVVRIENNETINVAGTIVYDGVISVGDAATVNATLFGGASNASLQGTVLACRGSSGGMDNRWQVVISCNNRDGTNSSVVPFNYNFSDGTTITLT